MTRVPLQNLIEDYEARLPPGGFGFVVGGPFVLPFL
jgi:hypothetical protein